MQNELNTLLAFTPYYKSVIWGGTKIAVLKGESNDMPDLGESWELSAVPGHESVVNAGPLAGQNVCQLIDRYGADLLGSRVIKQWGKSFPLLIKIIDARQNLSVQVHPDDELAAKRHNSRGKTEMWYVIDCEPDAHIYSGLCAPLSAESYVQRIADNSIMDVVACHKSAPGQFYYIPAGTIHAIGAGNLIAEIQETSDITYRVYDYDRRDAQGNPRQLHTKEAVDAIDYRFPNNVEPTARIMEGTTEAAVKCDFFTTDYVEIDGRREYDSDGSSFVILMVMDGEATVSIDGTDYKLTKGHTALVPAAVKHYALSGKATLLSVTC